jgi:hypothetical protein
MMENQDKNFNELLDKIKYGEATAPDAVWEKIETTLNQGRKRNAFYFWGLGLALTFIVAGSLAYFNQNSSETAEKTIIQTPFVGSKVSELNNQVADEPIPIEREKMGSNSGNVSLNASFENEGFSAKKETNIIQENSNKTTNDQDYTPTAEEMANQEKFAHSKVEPLSISLESMRIDSAITVENITPISGELTQKQLDKEYRLFSVYAGYGIFDQNLIMANPHADTVSFRAEKGHQFNVGLQYNVSKNWAVDFNYGHSTNNWTSAARIVVEEENAPAGLVPHVYMSTNFQFNEVTNASDVNEILNENPKQSDVRLVHKMKYAHYRLGVTYSINDFKHWDFRALLQTEYMQLRDVSTFFQAGDHSISYPVSGFKRGIWALRLGINLAYKLSDSFSIYTEASTSVRGTYLMKHPNWKIYENQFGLFCGVRYSW